MFNLTGGEIVILLLIGLVVLGPEKLPDAMRRFGRIYNEVRRIAGGIQNDVTSTFAEPLNELKKTANDARRMFDPDTDRAAVNQAGPSPEEGSHEPRFIPYEAADEAADAEPNEPGDDRGDVS